MKKTRRPITIGAMAPQDLSEIMQSYAEQAVAAARAQQIELDYSEESLKQVENILERLDAPLDRGAPDASPPEDAEELCKMWGGYLGEVVRRRWGGEWVLETYPGGNVLTVALSTPGGTVFPSLKIYRRLSQGAGENVWSFYCMMRDRFRAKPGGKVQ
jgi:hypothetical protein